MGSEKRILIVDDSAQIRMMLRVQLGDSFEIVGEATNGHDAIEATERLHPDLVLLDLGMPVMDGLEALPKIRAAHPEVKVVVLSGFPAREVEEQAVALGAAMYVEKGSPLASLGEQLKAITGSYFPT